MDPMQSGQMNVNSKERGCRRSSAPCASVLQGSRRRLAPLMGLVQPAAIARLTTGTMDAATPVYGSSRGRGDAMLTCTSCAPCDCLPARRRRAPRKRDLCSGWSPRCCSSGLCDCTTTPPAALTDCDSCDCTARPAAALECCDSVPAAAGPSSTACAAAWVLGSGRALWSAASEATFLVALHSVHAHEQGPNWQDQNALCWSSPRMR